MKKPNKLIILCLNLLSRTWRIKISGYLPEYPCFVIFWHGQMLGGWKAFKDKSAYAVVSLSKDGTLLSNLLEVWGFRLIRGSSSVGGKEVLDSIISNVKDSIILMTPDGPKGPNEKVKPGVIIASIRSRKPIVLSTIKCNFKIILKRNWDKFEIPLPFATIQIKYSTPYLFEQTEDKDLINNIINKIEKELINFNEN